MIPVPRRDKIVDFKLDEVRSYREDELEGELDAVRDLIVTIVAVEECLGSQAVHVADEKGLVFKVDVLPGSRL